MECLLAPKTKQSYLFLAPLQWPWQGCCRKKTQKCNAVRHSRVPPPPYRHYRHCPPPRPFASVRFDPLAWSSGSDQRRISGCGTGWLLAGPDSLPLWLCRVCAFVLLRCFSQISQICWLLFGTRAASERFKGNVISDIQLWIICVISTNDGQDVMGGWRNDQEGLKARGVQPALASVIHQSSLCVCQSRICSVSLFTVICQRKIGNKKEKRIRLGSRHIKCK